MSNNEQDYEMCFRVENVVLPKYGYFGVTAATGGLAGNNQHILYRNELTYLKMNVRSSHKNSRNTKINYRSRKMSKALVRFRLNFGFNRFRPI
jgi:hypothetical protein